MNNQQINLAIFDQIANASGLTTRDELIKKVNVAIAEACGWIPKKSWKLEGRIKKDFHWEHSVTGERTFKIPNYYEDLNACHVMEKILESDGGLKFEYHNHLFEILPCDENHGPCGLGSDGEENADIMTPSGFTMLHATAPQRCEAFLKTLAK
jgi:hypothetical protein